MSRWKCYLIAHRQPLSALERSSANVVVIIITPLWFNELVQLWLTHLSGLIKTVWVKDFLRYTAICQASNQLMQNFLQRVIYSSAPRWALKAPAYTSDSRSSPPPLYAVCGAMCSFLAVDIKRGKLATCSLWQAVKSFVKLLPRSCAIEEH